MSSSHRPHRPSLLTASIDQSLFRKPSTTTTTRTSSRATEDRTLPDPEIRSAGTITPTRSDLHSRHDEAPRPAAMTATEEAISALSVAQEIRRNSPQRADRALSSSMAAASTDTGNVFRALFEAAAKVGLSHAELETIVHNLESHVAHQSDQIEALQKENKKLSDRLEGYLEVAATAQARSVERETALVRQEERHHAQRLGEDLWTRTSEALNEGKGREHKLETMIRNAAEYSSKLEAHVTMQNAELRSGMFEMMKRMMRLSQQAGSANVQQLLSKNEKAVGKQYFIKWQRYAKSRSSIVVMTSDSAFMLAKRYLSLWLRFRAKQVRHKASVSQLQRSNVRAFLIRQFQLWQLYARSKHARRVGKVAHRSAVYGQLSLKADQVSRRNAFQKWFIWAKSQRKDKGSLQLVRQLGTQVVKDRRRRIFALWSLYASQRIKLRTDLRALQRLNLSTVAKTFFQKWVRWSHKGQIGLAVERSSAPLQRQVSALTAEVQELRHMLLGLLERHEGLGSVVESVARSKLAAKAVKPSSLIGGPPEVPTQVVPPTPTNISLNHSNILSASPSERAAMYQQQHHTLARSHDHSRHTSTGPQHGLGEAQPLGQPIQPTSVASVQRRASVADSDVLGRHPQPQRRDGVSGSARELHHHQQQFLRQLEPRGLPQQPWPGKDPIRTAIDEVLVYRPMTNEILSTSPSRPQQQASGVSPPQTRSPGFRSLTHNPPQMLRSSSTGSSSPSLNTDARLASTQQGMLRPGLLDRSHNNGRMTPNSPTRAGQGRFSLSH